MLGFEAQTSVFEMIAGVKLNARFGGADRHDATGFRILNATDFDNRIVIVGFEDEVVIVSVEFGIHRQKRIPHRLRSHHR